MASDDNAKKAKDAAKAVEDFINKTEQGKKNVDKMHETFSKISTELFGIAGSAFFKEIPKTTKELQEQRKAVSEIKNELGKSFENIGDSLKLQFKDALSALEAGPTVFDTSALGDMAKKYGIDTFTNINNLQSQINEKFKDNSDEISKFSADKKKYIEKENSYYKGTEQFYKQILEDNKDLFSGLSDQERIQKFQQLHQTGFNGLVSEGSGIISDMAIHSNNVDGEIQNIASNAINLKDKLSESTKELEKATKETFSLSNGLKAIGSNFAAGILPAMKDANQSFKDAQKEFGLIFDSSNYDNMAAITSEAARFGMSVKDTTEMMGQLGEGLKTTDTDYLASATEQFVSIGKATGIASEDIATMAEEMMRTGSSAEQTKEFMSSTNDLAKNFGVNSKNVLKNVSKNLSKMRNMGFQGGEESLARMAVRAERLNMNMEEMFDVAKKARSIEGAMEMASELQLAGGSFANIDPMTLLAAARKGPEELQKILTQMGGDIGEFNEKTGVLKFDAVDVDRLQVVADATGQTIESIQQGLMKTAADSNKINLFGDITGNLEDIDAEMVNSGLSDMLKLGKDGEIEFNASSQMAKRMGINSLEELQSLTGKQLKDKMEADKVTLEDQALTNQSFDDSVTAFKNSLLNLFNVFQPFFDAITSLIQFLTQYPVFTALTGAIIGLIAFGPKIISAFSTFGGNAMKMFEGAKEFGKGVLNFGKGTFDFIKQLTSGKVADAFSSVGNKIKDSFVNKAKDKATDKVVDIAAGAAGKVTEGAAQSVGQAVSAAATSKISGAINMTGLLKFSASMALIGLAVAAFGAGINQLGGVGVLEILVKGALAIGMLAIAVQLISLYGSLINIGGVAMFALSMALIGIAMIPFGYAMSLMAGVDWAVILVSLGTITALVLGLVLLGGLMMAGGFIALLAGVGTLIVVAASLLIAAYGLSVAAEAFQQLGNVNWTGFEKMGGALMGAIMPLAAFSLASMMFLNPFAILGIMAMTGTLGMLAMVMIPLGEGLAMAAEGIDRFSEGLEKLQAVAATLDFERLEALKDLSMSMAVGSSGGGLGDSINKIAEALDKLNGGGSGGGKGGTQKIQIDLKLNGRDVQSMITSDLQIVS